MESKNIAVSRSYKDGYGDTITVDAGRFEWQIVWGCGGGVTHAKTNKEFPKENLEDGIAYLKEYRSELTWIETGNRREDMEECTDYACPRGEAPSDNREEVIERARKHLLQGTNIESSPDEMKCLDYFLFRCWQMGWLKDYDDTKPKYDALRKALCMVKNAFKTDVIYAPGASPTYEQADKAQEVYRVVCESLGQEEKIKEMTSEEKILLPKIATCEGYEECIYKEVMGCEMCLHGEGAMTEDDLERRVRLVNKMMS